MTTLSLLTFPGSFGCPSHSPFCVKAMCLLQLSGFDWQPEYFDDPRKMPLSRLPVLRDGNSLIPDSTHIQAHLEAKGADFYPGMSEIDKARAHALMRMTEGTVHNVLVHDRWLVDESWEHTRKAFFDVIPFFLRGPVTRSLRKKVRSKLMAEGTAQFTEAERIEHLKRDLTAISLQLDTKPFLFGDMPSAADAAIAPFLDMILKLPVNTKARATLRGWEGLSEYVLRVRAAIYPEDNTAKISAAA